MKIEVSKDYEVRKFNHHYKFCVGSAHAAYALRNDYVNQLKMIHDDLGIQRVRFHGIFDDDMHTITKATSIIPFPFGGSYVEKTFRTVSVAFDNVLSVGMKPYVELSFMPKELAKFKLAKGMFYYRPNISMPKSLSKWHDYIVSFIKFLIDRYGKEEIESWYFEVWNEPDLIVPFFFGTKEDYFKLYVATVHAIKSVDKNIQVGGPATSGSKWVDELIEYCEKHRVPLDFVSTHQYAGDPIGGIKEEGKGVSEGIDVFAALKNKNTLSHNSILPLFRSFMGLEGIEKTLHKDSLVKSSKITKEKVKDRPLFYTEWNMCASFSAPVNDTNMPSAYLIHSILNTQDSIDGSSIWCFSDLFEEFHQFPEEFHGGFGLMTQSGIKKPSYMALELLSSCGDDLIDIVSEDSVDVAIFEDSKGYNIICSNLSFDYSDSIKNIEVVLPSDMKAKEISVSSVSSKKANPFKYWKELGSPQVPTKQQVDYIKKESQIEKYSLSGEYDKGFTKIDFDINSNEILMLKITY